MKKISLPDDATLRQQINAHLALDTDGLFRFRLNDDERERFAKHAPNFSAAFTSNDGSWSRIAAAASIDTERLYSAKISNSGLSAAGSQTLEELLELRHLFAHNAQRQAHVDALVSGHAPTGSAPELWRDADGKAVAVYRPQDKMASGSGGNAVGLGDIVRAMVTGRGLSDIQNALGTGSVGAGGALVPTTLADEVIDALRARSTVIRAGARTVRMPTQSLTVAKVTGDPTLSWAAEAASISDTGPTFGVVTLTAKTLRAWVKVSRELIEDAPNLGEVLRDTFARSMATEFDRVALVGSGSGAEPRGIGNATSAAPIVSMGTNGAALTNWDKVLDCLQTLQDANAADPTALIAAPRTLTTLAKLKTGISGDNTPLAVPAALAAIPRYATTAMPVNQVQGGASNASSIILGDFAQLLLGVRSELQIVKSEGVAMATNEVALLFVMRCDVGWTNAASFVQLRGIIP